jgi:arginyl-tRNA synthetase
MYEIDIKNRLQEITGLKDVKLSSPPPGVEGDLSTNAAMIAQADGHKVSAHLQELDCVEWARVVGPGFVNIRISDLALFGEVQEIASSPDNYARGLDKGKIILEMVSSNPTGPLHIGHGRGAAIGDSLGRILQWLGYEVFREYYVNDAGKQMDMLGLSILCRKQGKEVPQNGYKGEYINRIAEILTDCNTAPECREKASDMILQDHLDILKKFGVEYNGVFYESSLLDKGEVKAAIDSLSLKGLTYEKEGALWFKSTEFGDDTDRVLIKKDGELTYFASDCAYHGDKAQRFPYLIDIWGADHHGYIGRVKAFWRAMGYEDSKSLDILLYQLVNLKRGAQKISMSTREGEFVTLKEVIDEVGRDAARFFLLMRSADAPLEFDLELAKQESKTNPVYYVQYSHARICSVFRKAQVDPQSLDFKKAQELGIEERELVKIVAHFPYLLYKAGHLRAPHLITEYLRDVATVFHKYYDTVRVLGSDKQEPRLVLLKAVKDIIARGLELTGVSAPESM